MFDFRLMNTTDHSPQADLLPSKLLQLSFEGDLNRKVTRAFHRLYVMLIFVSVQVLLFSRNSLHTKMRFSVRGLFSIDNRLLLIVIVAPVGRGVRSQPSSSSTCRFSPRLSSTSRS